MRVFIVGASGFLGRCLLAALEEAGHDVLCGVRDTARPPRERSVPVDFTRDHRIEDWLPRLEGIHAVVNCVGILREHGGQTFSALHEEAPRALFAACAQAGVDKVIQISALGADEGARSRYHLSKRRADEFLVSLPVAWTIVRPSLVFGLGGESARLFTALATLPVSFFVTSDLNTTSRGGVVLTNVKLTTFDRRASAAPEAPEPRGGQMYDYRCCLIAAYLDATRTHLRPLGNAHR